MRKILQGVPGVLWLCLFQLLVLCAAGSEKWAGIIRTAGNTFIYTSFIRDTVPVSDTFDFYISTQGLNSNNGTSSSTPKLSFDSISTLISASASSRNTSLGLDSKSKFREEFDLSTGNMRISSFGMPDTGSKRVAQITGMNVVTEWTATPGKTNTYQYTVNHSIDLINPNYNYVFVAEIDTLAEKLFPVSAVRYLPLVSGIDLCEATPGSFSIATLTQNPITIYIHATEGVPGKNRFRYEVVKRPYNIYSYYNNNCTFEDLFLQSSANGYGMLGAGENTLVKNVTFQGGGTHHAVIQSGQVDHSLFLPGPKGLADEIALVFYKADGTGFRNYVSNAVFLDIAHPVFSHTYGSSSFRSMSFDSVYAFADTLNANYMLSGDNTDSIFISNSYSKGYKNFWIGEPSYLNIKNSVLHQMSESAIYIEGTSKNGCTTEVSNTLITTNGNDGNQRIPPRYQSCIGFAITHDNSVLQVSNSIFHGKSVWHKSYETVNVFVNTLNNNLQSHNNIFICDVNPGSYLFVSTANNSAGQGTSSNIKSDNNVYILVRGIFQWRSYPSSPQGDGSIFSLPDWQSFTGQDQHSIVLDLRNNPAGLKAVFTDPENGNWTLAQTPQADSIRQVHAGMLTPPLYYPLRPVYEDALDHTMPGGLSRFTGARDLNHQVKLDWETIYEPHFAYFGIESSQDNTHFSGTGTVATQGRYKNNQYSFSFSDTTSARVYYRLRMMNIDSSALYSSTISIDPSRKDSIINGIGRTSVGIIIYPNPAQSALMVEHPARDKSEISVFDYTGRKLIQVQVQTRSLSTSLSLLHIPAGKYIVEWSDGQEKKAIGFIKAK